MTFGNFKSQMLYQGRPNLWLGALKNLVVRTQSYYAIVNFVLLLITTLTVSSTSINKYLPWLNLFWLLVLLTVFVVVISIVDYKIIYPSEIAWNQQQAWKHMNPGRGEFAKLSIELAELKKLVLLIETKIDEHDNKVSVGVGNERQ